MANLMEEYLGEFRNKQLTIGLIHGDCEEDALYLCSLQGLKPYSTEYEMQRESNRTNNVRFLKQNHKTKS
mgnify:CR=1 FL=1